MAIGIVRNESSLALVVEVVEGTFVAPSAGTDYVAVLEEGLELNKNREELTRALLSSTVESEASRIGIAEVNGSVPTEFRASTTEGAAPQNLDVIMTSLMGGKRTGTSTATTTGNSPTVLVYASHPYAIGDIIVIQETGAFEVRPVLSITATTVTLAIALANGAPSDGVSTSAFTTYFSDTASSTTYSAEHNEGNEIQQQVTGLRSITGALDNWRVGQVPNFTTTVGGLTLERSDSGQSFSPDFSADALPPVALQACLYVGGVLRPYSELGLSVENTVNFIMDACDDDGKIGSRITKQITTFNANPYADDTTLDSWDDFNANDDTSIFFFAFNPSSTAGEFSEVVSVWIPQGKFTEHPFGDEEGITTDNVVVKAHRSLGNDSIFFGFI